MSQGLVLRIWGGLCNRTGISLSGVLAQDGIPAGIVIAALRLGEIAKVLPASMGKLDEGVLALSLKDHLDLLGGIGLATRIPGKDQPAGGLPCEHPAPLNPATVVNDLVDPAADAFFENAGLRMLFTHRMAEEGLPTRIAFGKQVECIFDAQADEYRFY